VVPRLLVQWGLVVPAAGGGGAVLPLAVIAFFQGFLDLAFGFRLELPTLVWLDLVVADIWSSSESEGTDGGP
jgi:hypothetical protein